MDRRVIHWLTLRMRARRNAPQPFATFKYQKVYRLGGSAHYKPKPGKYVYSSRG
mgnify:CR=1